MTSPTSLASQLRRRGRRVAALLVEINAACDDARRHGLRQLAPVRQRAFAARYDTLVAQGLAANPDPAQGRKRYYFQHRSHILVTAFRDHRRHVLRYMFDLEVAFTNNRVFAMKRGA